MISPKGEGFVSDFGPPCLLRTADCLLPTAFPWSDLANFKHPKTYFQRWRLGAEPEIVVLRIDEQRVRDERMGILGVLLPLFKRPVPELELFSIEMEIEVAIKLEMAVVPFALQQWPLFSNKRCCVRR